MFKDELEKTEKLHEAWLSQVREMNILNWCVSHAHS